MKIAAILSKEAQQFILDHEHKDPAAIMLEKKTVPGVPLKELVYQIKARSIIRSKIPDWYRQSGLVYPGSLPLEQCSSQLTAIYKSTTVAGDHLVDLTGGLGVDSYYFSKVFRKVTYVEKQPELFELTQHNFKVLKALNIDTIQGQAEQIMLTIEDAVDCFYLDPARRQGQQKIITIEQSEPVVPNLLPHLWRKADKVLLKLSPMLDIDHAIIELGQVKSVQVVSVKNECKELLLLLERGYRGPVNLTGINLLRNGNVQTLHCTREDEMNSDSRISGPLKFLYEPNSSVLKLGAFKLLCSRYRLYKLHANSHLYTSNRLKKDFPGRVFEIKWVSKYRRESIKKLLPSGKANLAVRNFPYDVASIRKTCSIQDGGEDYLFATTGPEEQLMLICGSRMVIKEGA